MEHAASPRRTCENASPPLFAAADLLTGTYVTDGLRLFRVVSQMSGARLPLASLEDCRTLDVQTYTAGDLYAMRLRRVTTEPSS